MPVERSPGGTSLIDVLDRVLDKGIVIDAWVRVSLVGIDLITAEARRVVVASIETCLKYAASVHPIIGSHNSDDDAIEDANDERGSPDIAKASPPSRTQRRRTAAKS